MFIRFFHLPVGSIGHLGSWTHAAIPGTRALFWLALAGFGLKAGLFPLHIWLPSAHANAPSHVSALLSGVAIKMEFTAWSDSPVGCQSQIRRMVIGALGVASAVLGVAFALAQHDLKRLLAYHSVENIGIILIGLGFAMIADANGHPAWGQLALFGGMLHVWNHWALQGSPLPGGGICSACDRHPVHEQPRWALALNALDRWLFRARGCRDFRAAASQWLCQ